MSSTAKIDRAGTMRQLDGRAAPSEVVTEQDAKDPAYVARILARILTDIATMRRRWAARTLVFEDVDLFAGGARHQLAHNFKGRVRWRVTESTVPPPVIDEDEDATTDNILVLRSYVAATCTIVVEEAG